jgi:hypothetical protein
MAAKHGLAAASRVVWRKPLDRESTIGMLAGNEIKSPMMAFFTCPTENLQRENTILQSSVSGMSCSTVSMCGG